MGKFVLGILAGIAIVGGARAYYNGLYGDAVLLWVVATTIVVAVVTQWAVSDPDKK